MTYTGFACADEGLQQRHGNGMLQGSLLIFHQYLTLVNFNLDSPLEVPASLRQAASTEYEMHVFSPIAVFFLAHLRISRASLAL